MKKTRLTTKDAAIYIGCAVFTLRASRHYGTLYGFPSPEYIKLGRSVFYESATLDTWLDTHCKTLHNTAQEG